MPTSDEDHSGTGGEDREETSGNRTSNEDTSSESSDDTSDNDSSNDSNDDNGSNSSKWDDSDSDQKSAHKKRAMHKTKPKTGRASATTAVLHTTPLAGDEGRAHPSGNWRQA